MNKDMVFNTPLSKHFSTRVTKSFNNIGLFTVKDLLNKNYNDFRRGPGIGDETIRNIQYLLETLGYYVFQSAHTKEQFYWQNVKDKRNERQTIPRS